MSPKSAVAIVKTTDRVAGIEQAVELLGINPAKGKDVLIKPNFNTADPFPASTHNDTLETIIKLSKKMGATSVTVGDRSGPVDTGDVLTEMGIHQLCARHGAELINFEEMPKDRWERIKFKGMHWSHGFRFARPVLEAGCVITTCCLKTHGYGGVFTMSLKLSIGAVHGAEMSELHTSFKSMRKMIAEVNTAYTPGLVVMDAMEVFVDKGPMQGPRKHAGFMVTGTDRVAIDAVGLAVLKTLGSNSDIMDTPIWEQQQIKRAVELGLGAPSPDAIQLLFDEAHTKDVAPVRGMLNRG